MRKRLTALALGGTLGVAGLAGGAVVVPAVATAATSEGADAGTEIAERVDRIREALAGLVSDGTLDQAEADRVAETLAERLPGRGFRGHGHRGGADLDAAAQALGIPEEELRDALRNGRTVAELAGERDVEVSAVVDALVATAGERLSEAVADGRLTQAEADEKNAALRERIATWVQEGGPLGRGPGRGHGHGRFGGDGPDDEQGAAEATPDATPEPDVEGSSARAQRGSGWGVVRV